MSIKLRLGDSVIARIAQAVQEAMLFGIDVVDILREIELEQQDGTSELVLTQEYAQKVIENHKQLVEKADDLKILSSLNDDEHKA